MTPDEIKAFLKLGDNVAYTALVQRSRGISSDLDRDALLNELATVCTGKAKEISVRAKAREQLSFTDLLLAKLETFLMDQAIENDPEGFLREIEADAALKPASEAKISSEPDPVPPTVKPPKRLATQQEVDDFAPHLAADVRYAAWDADPDRPKATRKQFRRT